MEKEFIDKSMTLRQIAHKHNCSRSYVRNILSEKLDSFDAFQNRVKNLDQKVIDTIKAEKIEGKSFADIANDFNRIGIKTKTEKGQWHAKTVRDVYMSTHLAMEPNT